MIPKIIHYCWLSDDPYPKDVQNYIESWKQKLPDYEFIRWDFERFGYHTSIWVKQAYEAGKYAYAADYIRLYALFHHGGIYMDSDVELLKSFDDLLFLPYFAGTEGGGWIEAAVLASAPQSSWVKDCLDYFEKPFIKADGSYDMVTLPQVMNKIISAQRDIHVADRFSISQKASEDYGSKFYLFEKDYFSAKDMGTGVLKITDNTYAVHHFAMSWISAKDRLLPDIKRQLIKIFGERTVLWPVKIVKKFRR